MLTTTPLTININVYSYLLFYGLQKTLHSQKYDSIRDSLNIHEFIITWGKKNGDLIKSVLTKLKYIRLVIITDYLASSIVVKLQSKTKKRFE